MADLTARRGDTEFYDLTITRNGSPIHLGAAQALRFTVKVSKSDPDIRALIRATLGDGVTVTNAASGLATVTVAPADTAPLPGGDYYYDVQITESGGRVTTVVEGTWTLEADVTRATS